MTAELLNEIQAEVHRRIDAAAAQHAPILRNQFFRAPNDPGIAAAEIVRSRPMRGCLAPVQETGLGKIGGAGASAGNKSALSRSSPQPRKECGMTRELVLQIQPG